MSAEHSVGVLVGLDCGVLPSASLSDSRSGAATKRGRPVAVVKSIRAVRRNPTLGRRKGRAEIKGDIVHSDWTDEGDADDKS